MLSMAISGVGGVGGGGTTGTFSAAAQGQLFSDRGLQQLVRLQNMSLRVEEQIERNTSGLLDDDAVER